MNERMKGKCTMLPLIGYAFVAAVAVIAALQVDKGVLKCLLITSAVVSLVLAVTRFFSSRKMNARIKYLEEHHWSVTQDEGKEELIFNEGIGK